MWSRTLVLLAAFCSLALGQLPDFEEWFPSWFSGQAGSAGPAAVVASPQTDSEIFSRLDLGLEPSKVHRTWGWSLFQVHRTWGWSLSKVHRTWGWSLFKVHKPHRIKLLGLSLQALLCRFQRKPKQFGEISGYSQELCQSVF